MTVKGLIDDLSDFDPRSGPGLILSRLEFQSRLQRIHLPGGAVLFQEGDPADSLYMVMSGALGVSFQGGHGEQRRIACIEPPRRSGKWRSFPMHPFGHGHCAQGFPAAQAGSRGFRPPDRALALGHALPFEAPGRQASGGDTQCASHLLAPTTFALVPVTKGVDATDFAQALLREMRRSQGCGS